MSQRFDDGTGNEPDTAFNFNRSSNRDDSRVVGFKCPECGATCRTSHCYDCDIDLPMSARYDSANGYLDDHPTISFKSSGFDKSVGKYFSVDSRGKRFKIKGDDEYYSFSDLVNYVKIILR